MAVAPDGRIRDGARPIDLDGESRRALEFGVLLDWIAGFARTARGAARILELRPTAEVSAITEWGELVEDTARFVEREGPLLDRRLPDPARAIEQLAVAQMVLEPRTLRDLASFGSAAADVRRRANPSPGPAPPRLQQKVAELPDLDQECREVLSGIAPDGRIEDSASPELARVRAARARTAERLRRLLGDILRDPDSEALVRDDFVTQRNGRFVIPLRTDAPRPLEGIVHARSSSGATRFVEPLQSVELNNELVRLEDAEHEEQARILAAWSASFRRRLDDVRALAETLACLDDFQARVLFARETDAVVARVREGAALRLRHVRHPLLERHLREQRAVSVPLSIVLDPFDRVLVVSGPNTGGKTVALKSLGLSVLMAQSGIPVPASEVELPPFAQIRADIGDHQSIEADLSTYSAHVRAIVSILGRVETPALFLFDEIGTGTEPTEGAALAQSVLESLRRPGVTAVATTHLGPVKTWAIGTEGALAAAMEFDERSLRPTYRILMDVAGTSAGLEIAERMGLAPALVSRARELLDPGTRASEAQLRRLRELVSEAEARQAALDEEHARLEEARSALERRAEALEERLRRESSKRLDRALSELSAEGRRELETIRDRKERARAEKRWIRSETRLEGVKRSGEASWGRPENDDRNWIVPRTIREGMVVRVAHLEKDGEVVDVGDRRVEVRLGSVTLSVAPDELRVPADGDSTAPSERPARTVVNEPSREARASSRELMLLGQTVDEALERVDRFLDRAALEGWDQVRIVHGHGTGRLKAAVRRHLRRHAQVATWRPGAEGEGGDGPTVVELGT